MILDKELKMKFYNLNSLVALLLLTGINIYLNNSWTTDKGFLSLMILIFGTTSVMFWFILSTISSYKETHLKNELFYYIGIGIWQIIITIEYFKLKIFDENNVIFWIPYFLIITLTLLPIKQIWSNQKESKIPV